MVMRLAALVISGIFRIFSLFPQRRCIALLSRQSARPFDFELLEPALRRAFPDYKLVWCCVAHGGEMTVPLMLKQLWYVATAEVCLVDGYVPAVSIPRGPRRSACIQLWHALGAIKKFGFQSLHTAAGRSPEAARAFSMHAGYGCIVAGLSGAVPAFAEAFGYPESAFLPLGLPRCDYLLRPEYAGMRAERSAALAAEIAALPAVGEGDASIAHDGPALDEPRGDQREGVGADCTTRTRTNRPVVLYAPTFRKNNANPAWLADAVCALDASLPAEVALLISAHPLDVEHLEGRALTPRVRVVHGTATIDALAVADYVVTDYSAVAFEAMLASVKTYFYVPDIEEYRNSPGLNVDPLRDAPGISTADAEALAHLVADDLACGSYDRTCETAFARGYGIDPDPAACAVDAIVDVVRGYLKR